MSHMDGIMQGLESGIELNKLYWIFVPGDRSQSCYTSPLHIAAEQGNSHVVQLLINNNAMVDIRDLSGATPLHRAAFHGQEDVVNTLLLNGADPNAPDADGLSPMHIAAWMGQTQIFEQLWMGGGQLNTCSNDGETPLHVACIEGHQDTVEKLLALGCCFIENKDGFTPEDIAAAHNHTHLLPLLQQKRQV
mmetsp:Transcript_1565/g.4727  ORF Transcript_1565/g.4727 Transcript_1565/m.4727 type:complete len:191 (+) Transcript_1565:510-1082(+)